MDTSNAVAPQRLGLQAVSPSSYPGVPPGSFSFDVRTPESTVVLYSESERALRSWLNGLATLSQESSPQLSVAREHDPAPSERDEAVDSGVATILVGDVNEPLHTSMTQLGSSLRLLQHVVDDDTEDAAPTPPPKHSALLVGFPSPKRRMVVSEQGVVCEVRFLIWQVRLPNMAGAASQYGRCASSEGSVCSPSRLPLSSSTTASPAWSSRCSTTLSCRPAPSGWRLARGTRSRCSSPHPAVRRRAGRCSCAPHEIRRTPFASVGGPW